MLSPDTITKGIEDINSLTDAIGISQCLEFEKISNSKITKVEEVENK